MSVVQILIGIDNNLVYYILYDRFYRVQNVSEKEPGSMMLTDIKQDMKKICEAV